MKFNSITFLLFIAVFFLVWPLVAPRKHLRWIYLSFSVNIYGITQGLKGVKADSDRQCKFDNGDKFGQRRRTNIREIILKAVGNKVKILEYNKSA